MSPPDSGRRAEAWLLKPWNAAFCLWALVWGILLIYGSLDHLRSEHADRLWQIGWAWALFIVGMPLSPLLLSILEHTSGLSPLNVFLIAWVTNAAGSFAIWLIVIPLICRWLITDHSTRAREKPSRTG